MCPRTDCKYATWLNGDNGCDYILIEGHRRGCPADENCTKYVKRKGRKKAQLTLAGFLYDGEEHP